ncbi:MAG: hypothetical protein AAB847_00630 [Patescibacteria group bacterium]
MARQDTEFTIDQGPSKHDLMLSLFDTEMGARIVKFRRAHDEEGEHGFWIYDVQIVSARRRDPGATIWEIEGITNAQGERMRVSIYYLSDTREGRMKFEEKLRTHSIMETPDDVKRAKALMIVVQKMIAMYQNSHSGNLDDNIFKLFEKAKRVHYAEDRDSLNEAIKNI